MRGRRGHEESTACWNTPLVSGNVISAASLGTGQGQQKNRSTWPLRLIRILQHAYINTVPEIVCSYCYQTWQAAKKTQTQQTPKHRDHLLIANHQYMCSLHCTFSLTTLEEKEIRKKGQVTTTPTQTEIIITTKDKIKTSKMLFLIACISCHYISTTCSHLSILNVFILCHHRNTKHLPTYPL